LNGPSEFGDRVEAELEFWVLVSGYREVEDDIYYRKKVGESFA
jgi:hypothetical protein